MSRRNTYGDDVRPGGGLIAAFALTMVLTLGAFFLANAGLFDPTPLARAGVPPRGDVMVFSNGELAQRSRRSEVHLAAKWPAGTPASLTLE